MLKDLPLENSDITDDSSDEEFSCNILQKFSSDSEDVDSVTEEDPGCNDKENQEPSPHSKCSTCNMFFCVNEKKIVFMIIIKCEFLPLLCIKYNFDNFFVL